MLPRKRSDIMIGDFWGIEKIMPEYFNRERNGISIIKINNQKGQELFGKISGNIEYHESNYKDGFRANHKSAVILNEKRFRLMGELDQVEINTLLEKYNQFKIGKKAEKEAQKNTM